MFELFVLGSFGFWALMVFACVLLFYCAENDCGGLATVTVIVSLCLLNWFGQIPVFAYLWNNPWVILPGIAGYFALGTLWGVGKWFFYVKDQREKYDELKRLFIERNRLGIEVTDPIPDENKESWASACASWRSSFGSHYNDHGLDVVPQVRSHKMEIYVWIAYWPWSFVWTIVNDPVRKIFNKIYNAIHGWLQSISNHYFADTAQDFRAVPKVSRRSPTKAPDADLDDDEPPVNLR